MNNQISVYNSRLQSFEHEGKIIYGSDVNYLTHEIHIIQDRPITEHELNALFELIDKIRDQIWIESRIVFINQKVKVLRKMYWQNNKKLYMNSLYDIQKLTALGLIDINPNTHQKAKKDHCFELVFKFGVDQ
jgi:hypothetical protein